VSVTFVDAGVTASVAGSTHVTDEPEPVMVPAPTVHAYVRVDGDVSTSVTVADSVTLDERSTNGEGGLLPGPVTRRFEIAGGALSPLGATNVAVPDAVLPPLVTTNEPAPVACVGAGNVMLVDVTVEPVTATPSSVTAESVPKPVPAIVTVTPPVVESDAGDTDVTVNVAPPGVVGVVPPQLMAKIASAPIAARRSGGLGDQSALRQIS
jgi:hypothetical protein